MAVDVSILLVNWNTRELTLRCLDSLAGAFDDDLSYQVVVVDNGSVDGSSDALERRRDIARLIVNGENRGYAAAVNQAYAASTGNLVLLLNSDVVFRPGCVSTLVRFLRERPEVAGVAPLYLNPDGTPQEHYYRLPTFWTVLAASNALLRNLPPFERRIRSYRMLDDDFSQPRPVPQPSASCVLLRRSCLPAGHIFDERYPVYFNDVALARDLAERGDQLWMTPDAAVLHEHGASCLLLGGKLKRQHLGGLVRYLAATEPRHRVAAFRALALIQGALNRILRRPEAMSIADAWHAVRGDVGPLPQVPDEVRDSRAAQPSPRTVGGRT
jgi:GT2 family glycosyltransferase